MVQALIGKGLYSRAVLIDTGAFLALANSRDTHHSAAFECLKSIAKYRLPIFISLPTIYESFRRILFDLGQQSARRFLDQVLDGSDNLKRTIIEDEHEARKLIQRYAALQLTLTDAANMALMIRLEIAVVFSFDRHFLQAGFIRIPPFHLS